MTEKNVNYHKADIKLPFRLYNPDGSAVMEADKETHELKVAERKLTPGDVMILKGQGYIVELVENNRMVGIDKSQTSHDKES